MAELTFRVFGEPKAQPRQRSFVLRGRGGKPILDKAGAPIVRTYDPSTAEGFKNAIAIAAKEFRPASPIAAPITLAADFLFARPQRLMRKKDPIGRIPHVSKPDRDNVEKSLTDSLKAIGFIVDDCQICAGEIRKFYVAMGESPGAEIRMTWPDEEQP